MKRYIISKFIKLTGHVIEGRGWSKSVAQKRFKRALQAFRKLMSEHRNDPKSNNVIVSTGTFGKSGKIWTRKQLVNTVLARQKSE